MSVTLTLDAVVVTLPDPAGGTPLASVRRQVLSRTQSGLPVVHDLGVETHEIEVAWESLTAAEKDALLDFFGDTAEGMLNPWTYTDEYGTSYAARFLEPRLEFRKNARDMYDARVLLELDAPGA